MAERAEQPDVETPDVVPSSAGGVGAAMAAAMGRRRAAHRPDPELDAFLREQTRLAQLQTEHLHEQRTVILLRLRLGAWKDRVTLALQALTALVGVAVAAAIAAMAWQAHEDHALVIEPFSAPPAYTQQGLTGQALASELMDRLSAIARIAREHSLNGVSGVRADSADEVKVEIPDTGVSVADIQRLLRDWLGHERRVQGELRQAADGQLLLIARLDGQAFTAVGPAASLDQLEQQTAEQVFASAEPVSNVFYLAATDRRIQALDAARKLAQTNPVDLALWSNLESNFDPLQALHLVRLAVKMNRPAWNIDFNDAGDELIFGHDEAARAAARRLLADLSGGARNPKRTLSAAGAQRLRILAQIIIASSEGVYASAPPYGDRPVSVLGFPSDAETAARAHDLRRARDLLDQAVTSGAAEDAGFAQARGLLDAEAGDWPAAASSFRTAMDRSRAAHTDDPDSQGVAAFAEVAEIDNDPPLAEALAQMGDFSGAEAAIAPTPLDCYPCLRERGRLAAMQGHWSEADRWFAEAVRQGPSLPFADTDWGEMLLRTGDPTGAIVKLAQAHKLGSHDADPLELWGEALMAEHDYVGAISKFAEADKDAPKWGCNHLRWGEALMLSGRYAEARAQYQAANGLGLSVGDRAALNVLLARTAKGPLHG
jgi:tetratricopeptide (TPR) repeat protein